MIEAIVDHITKRGFIVDVRPRMLLIRKYFKGELCSINWCISHLDLQPHLLDCFLDEADRYMAKIDQAIIEKYGAQA